MYFSKTKKELKKLTKIPVLSILSYLAVILVFGYLLKEISALGNLAYIVTTVILPLTGHIMDWFTGGNLMKALYKDWIGLPVMTHLLIIVGSLIILYLINFLIKIIISKELWSKKILGK